jgi:hypothetical protein
VFLKTREAENFLGFYLELSQPLTTVEQRTADEVLKSSPAFGNTLVSCRQSLNA